MDDAAQLIETPSGKGASDENFPVGSFLIRADLRVHVHALYGFARAADDIADNPDLEPDDKVRRLRRLGTILDGGVEPDLARIQSPNAVRLVASLAQCGVSTAHAHDLLAAFTQDARKARYRDWDELLAYCFLSAAPIGRHLLDLHGEGPACRPAADALCNALQVVNHLQDCGADYRTLDRVYLPTDDLVREGVDPAGLGGDRLTPGLRRVLDRVLDPLQRLLAESAPIATEIEDTRIALECEIIRRMCVRLAERLAREDPLATRVVLSKSAAGWLAAGAVLGALAARRRAGRGRAAIAA